MKDTLTQIDQRIIQLKQKKEKLQAHLAATFLKEAQNIFGANEFSMELALSVLSHSWKAASEKQKEAWHKSASSFPRSSQRSRKTTLKSPAAHS